MSDGFARADAGGLAVWFAGPADAAPLVFCHGMALDHSDLAPLALCFAASRRVILWDMPGHGESQPPPAEWCLGSMAEALGGVLDLLGVKSATLVGFSFGGMVAQAYTRAHPERVRALVAYGCFAPFHLPPPVALDAVPGFIEQLCGSLDWPALQAQFAGQCCESEAGRALVRAQMAPLGRDGFLEMTRSLFEAFDPEPDFRFSCPIGLIAGAKDTNAALLELSFAALMEAHPGALRAEIPAAGHCAHLDRPAETHAALAAMLAALDPIPGERR